MQNIKKKSFFSIILVFSAFYISLSYNIFPNILIEGTIQSGVVNYPDQFNLYRSVSMNSWTLPIQIAGLLIKYNVTPLIISRIIIFTTTLLFLIGIFLTTRSLTNSNFIAILLSFLVVLLKKNFGDLDYPTLMFTNHTNGLIAQALITLIFGLLISNNLKYAFFFSVILIAVHPTVGVWLNSIFLLTLFFQFKFYKKIFFDKKIFFHIFIAFTIILISFLIFIEQKLPLDISYDDEAYQTYMSVWEAHRTGYGLYANSINFNYINKTLILIFLIFIFLKYKLDKNNSNFGLYVLLVNCILSFLLYIIYKYFYYIFPDFIVKVIPTRFFLLHSVIGWPIIFSITYLLANSIFSKTNLNLKYVNYFFILILFSHLLQHNSKIIKNFESIKYNILVSHSDNRENEFWGKLEQINLDGFFLTSLDSNLCQKTLALAKKPIFYCPSSIDYIPYMPNTAGQTKEIIEKIYQISFDAPKIKHMGGVKDEELKISYTNKTNNDWLDLKNKFNITALIVPKDWMINLEVHFSGDKYNFYIIK
jgi:hypothetical protein